MKENDPKVCKQCIQQDIWCSKAMFLPARTVHVGELGNEIVFEKIKDCPEWKGGEHEP